MVFEGLLGRKEVFRMSRMAFNGGSLGFLGFLDGWWLVVCGIRSNVRQPQRAAGGGLNWLPHGTDEVGWRW